MKALVVEDDPRLRQYMSTMLSARGYEPVLCQDGESAWQYCQEATFPLVILDLMLPGINGLELCRRIRRLDHGDDFYILVVTSLTAHPDLIEIMEAGADDYCAKPVDEDRARMRLLVAQRNIRARQERRENEKKMRYLANHDSLTGLSNRHAFFEFLGHALSHAQRYERRGVVVFIDLDGFKRINDSLGHSAGDYVLVETAKRLREVVREADLVCRFGGDEFTLVLTDLTDDRDILIVQEKTKQALAMPYRIDGNDYYLGASIGLARYPDDGFSADELVHKADLRMYRKKNMSNGRSSFASKREYHKNAQLE